MPAMAPVSALTPAMEQIGVEPDHRRGHERKAAADAVVAAVELAPLGRREVHVRLKRLGLGG